MLNQIDYLLKHETNYLPKLFVLLEPSKLFSLLLLLFRSMPAPSSTKEAEEQNSRSGNQDDCVENWQFFFFLNQNMRKERF